MFTQIITMFTQYFKECQPFFLTFTTGFSKSWHRLNEPFGGVKLKSTVHPYLTNPPDIEKLI